MTPGALRALRTSIKHWERNAAAEAPWHVWKGPASCALCHLFYADDCVGCPVSENTASSFCIGSPYSDAQRAHEHWWDNPTPETEAAFRAAARAEVDFLKSLLPADAPKHLATDDTGDGR